MVTIRHTEISAAAAGVLGKGFTAESVGKTVQQYAKSMVDLAKDKLPTSKDEHTLIETPLGAFKINYKESGMKKNPDGTESKIGINYGVNVALPVFFLEAINAVVEIGKTVVDGIKKAA